MSVYYQIKKVGDCFRGIGKKLVFLQVKSRRDVRII